MKINFIDFHEYTEPNLFSILSALVVQAMMTPSDVVLLLANAGVSEAF